VDTEYIEQLLEALRVVANAYGLRLLPSCNGRIEVKKARKPPACSVEDAKNQMILLLERK